MTNRIQRREEALTVVEPFLNEWSSRSSDHPSAFRNWAVEQLLWDRNLSTEQVEATITDGTGDMGIDAWFFANEEEPKTLFLIQSKDTRPERAELTKLKDGLTGLFDPLRSGEGNQEVRTRAAEFAQSISDLDEPANHGVMIEFHLVTSEIAAQNLQTDGGPLWTEQITLLDQTFSAGFYVHDIEDLSKNLRLIHNDPINWKFSVGVDDFFLYETENHFRTLSVAVRADLLASLFNEHRLNLFRLNPRYFLQTRTSVNRKILETLNSDDPYNFYLYNNGVTATCSGVTPVMNDGNPRIEVVDFQIVNGCQTTASIHEVWRNASGVGLDRVRVPMRIIETQSAPTIARIIARTTNDQNPVRPEDFHSGDAVQERLHSDFDLMDPRWFYENKRGVWNTEYRGAQARFPYTGEPHNPRRIMMKDLGQACLASLGRPADAADKASSIFNVDDTYNRVFPSSITANQMLLPYILYLEGDRLCRTKASSYQWSTNYLRYPMVFCVTRLIQMLLGQTQDDVYLSSDQSKKLLDTLPSWSKRLFDVSFEELAKELESLSTGGVGARTVVRREGWVQNPVLSAENRIRDVLRTEAEVADQQQVHLNSIGLRALFPYPIE